MQSTITCRQIGTVTWENKTDYIFDACDSIHVWKIIISENIPAINNMQALLSDDELKRAGRYHQQNDRERFIISRGALRVLLGRYLNLDARAIVFKAGVDKKPFVQNAAETNIHYNTTHSGNYVLIAVGQTPVGIDIENQEPMFQYQGILTHSFSEPEITYIEQAENPLKTFYTLWTRKEALLKATGKGIDDDMKRIPSIDGKHAVAGSLIKSDKDWFANGFEIDECYAGTIAATIEHVKFINLELSGFGIY